jgi:hypothetical protein
MSYSLCDHESEYEALVRPSFATVLNVERRVAVSYNLGYGGNICFVVCLLEPAQKYVGDVPQHYTITTFDVNVPSIFI